VTFLLDDLHEQLNCCGLKQTVDTIWGDGTRDVEVGQKAWHRHKQRYGSVITINSFYG
jgi:hypothetical protein